MEENKITKTNTCPHSEEKICNKCHKSKKVIIITVIVLIVIIISYIIYENKDNYSDKNIETKAGLNNYFDNEVLTDLEDYDYTIEEYYIDSIENDSDGLAEFLGQL